MKTGVEAEGVRVEGAQEDGRGTEGPVGSSKESSAWEAFTGSEYRVYTYLYTYRYYRYYRVYTYFVCLGDDHSARCVLP